MAAVPETPKTRSLPPKKAMLSCTLQYGRRSAFSAFKRFATAPTDRKDIPGLIGSAASASPKKRAGVVRELLSEIEKNPNIPQAIKQCRDGLSTVLSKSCPSREFVNELIAFGSDSKALDTIAEGAVELLNSLDGNTAANASNFLQSLIPYLSDCGVDRVNTSVMAAFEDPVSPSARTAALGVFPELFTNQDRYGQRDIYLSVSSRASSMELRTFKERVRTILERPLELVA